MKEYYFSKSHECFKLEDNVATISITEYAVEQLGEITYVQLPEIGDEFKKSEPFGEIESVKTVSELYAPVGGRVVDINTDLLTTPELVNQDSCGAGWLLKLELTHLEEVETCLNAADYDDYVEKLA